MTTDTAEHTAKSGFCLTGSHMGCTRHPLALRWCSCTCHTSPAIPATLAQDGLGASPPTTTHPRTMEGGRAA